MSSVHPVITSVDDAKTPAISSVHPDIIQTHIFTRLDGPTLASAACASSQLHLLSTDNTLWREICNDTWPSTSNPRVDNVISSFPSGHRSFYSDSFPSIHRKITPSTGPPASELISAVDLHFGKEPVLSRVQHTETRTDWFMSSPFRVDVLDPKETVKTLVSMDEADKCLEHDLSLSWVIIDPAQRRAANLCSLKSVSLTRHWLTGDLHIRFAKILEPSKGEPVQCTAVITCKRSEKGEVQVKDLSFVVEDMEGRSLSGEESLVILQGAIENGERRRRKHGDDETEMYEEFLEMKRERRESKEMKEKRMDMVCVFTVVTLIVTWGCFLLKVSS